MKKYIPTLMEMYQDMIKHNFDADNKFKKWKSKNPSKPNWEYRYSENETSKYSETMLHSIITVINKLNNR